jgi:hypothetical protein
VTRIPPSWLGEVTGDVVFATVSGADLYGSPSADSDVDLRGVHLKRLAGEATAMTARLEDERDRSALPDRPSAEPSRHDFVVRARLGRHPHVNSRSQG